MRQKIISIGPMSRYDRANSMFHAMTYVVTESCIRCKYTDCVSVCPVDCFHEGPNFLVINPEECIDCHLCVPECPVDAIFSEVDLPDDQVEFIEINANLSKQWPIIDTVKPAPQDAEHWANVKDKKHLIDRSGGRSDGSG